MFLEKGFVVNLIHPFDLDLQGDPVLFNGFAAAGFFIDQWAIFHGENRAVQHGLGIVLFYQLQEILFDKAHSDFIGHDLLNIEFSRAVVKQGYGNVIYMGWQGATEGVEPAVLLTPDDCPHE